MVEPPNTIHILIIECFRIFKNSIVRLNDFCAIVQIGGLHMFFES
jgi:hypothetical protein